TSLKTFRCAGGHNLGWRFRRGVPRRILSVQLDPITKISVSAPGCNNPIKLGIYRSLGICYRQRQEKFGKNSHWKVTGRTPQCIPFAYEIMAIEYCHVKIPSVNIGSRAGATRSPYFPSG